MDIERSRIEEDLQGVIAGQVRCDDTFVQMYASDASIYETKPLAVVVPENSQDVVQCVKYATENQIPIIPRGAATNVIGGCVGSGIIIDFAHKMNRIVSVDRDSVTVEPGVVLADLNRELVSHNRRFGPDPATRRVSTIGGVLGLNASGSKWKLYGTPRDKVLELEVVLANGTIAKINSFSMPENASDPHTAHLESKLVSLYHRNDLNITKYKPVTQINQAGYNLFDSVQQNRADLTRLIVGSEGTLGLITQAKLLTEPRPRHRGVAMLFFDQQEKAAQAAIEIGKQDVVACDLIDRRFVTLACETNPAYSRLIPNDAESVLLVEVQADDHASLQDRLGQLKNRIQNRRRLAFDIRTTTQEPERDLFWRLTRWIIPTLYRLRGNKRALTFIDDIAVAPDRLPKFLKVLHLILNEFEVTASIFSHTPQGLIHVRPFLDLADPSDGKKMNRLAEAIFDKVIEFNGTVSGACGDGLSRSWYLKRQYRELYPAMVAIKRTFDPLNIFNPGKIIEHGKGQVDRSLRLVKPLKPMEGVDSASTEVAENELPVLQPELSWGLDQIALAARNCNGCGRCRTALTGERMCPMFRQSHSEEATPRAKANLIRALVTGQIPATSVSNEEFKEVADLCFHCHQCRLDCPAGVDVPKLMVEAKANYYTANGLKLSDWILTRLDWFYEIAGRFPRLSNFLIKNTTARSLLERLLGIASQRKLPRFATQSFSRWAVRNRLRRTSTQQSRKVCYFVDAFAMYNDPELGRAFVNILKHNRIDVVVPGGQGISGMSLISNGALAPARKIANQNVEILSELARQGYQIVTTEPSAALALKHEYLNLSNEVDAEIVAEKTTDACSYLWQLHQTGELELDFTPQVFQVGYHLPCHQRVFTDDPPAMKLLKLVPGLQVERIEQGCSGMAGTWGLKSKNFAQSQKIGFGLMNAVRNSTIVAGTTECSTCKIQMEQDTTKPTVHPIKILAKAYGLMPELNDLFLRRSEDLVTS